MATSACLNLCCACGKDFGGVTAFDQHRVGKHAYLFDLDHSDGRRCLSGEEMYERGMFLNTQGRWSQAANGLSDRLGLAQEATRA